MAKIEPKLAVADDGLLIVISENGSVWTYNYKVTPGSWQNITELPEAE
ncbi:MAG TPA: hypothetical protein VD947_01765 [Patescibacteria group bacterium]|nr:hypothetical protein [Patescibacteria group bacterium]